MAAVNPYLRIAPHVASALADRRPVVALESTIIAHGFSYPANVECALTAERMARDDGAVPATIAVLGGRLVVGLSEGEIEDFGRRGAREVPKASRRDVPVLLAKGLDGATTVAATMLIAHMAGIQLFATGGIGGVHRGGQETLDVSADLLELGRTDVSVVCAGVKSILDIGLTLEVLETNGVPVLGYRTDEFPAFYMRESGHRVDVRVETPREAAEVIRAKTLSGIDGGLIVANAIPSEHAIEPDRLESWTSQALAEAQVRGVHGKDVTPFLLARIHELSGGASETANKELVYDNVRLAAKIGRELAHLARESDRPA